MTTVARVLASVTGAAILMGCTRQMTIRLPPAEDRDQAAVAAAIGWLLRAVPATVYTVEVGGKPATVELLSLIMSVAPAAPVGPGDTWTPGLEIAAAAPVWQGPTETTVTLRYVSGTDLNTCVVKLRAADIEARNWRVHVPDCAAARR